MPTEEDAGTRDQGLLIAVTTLGRVEALGELLRSAAPQLGEHDVISVVSQGSHEEVAALCRTYRPVLGSRIVHSQSSRGASTGRNAAVEAVQDRAHDRLILFPNDTTSFPDGALLAIRAAMGDAPAGAVTVMTDEGPRFDLPAPRTPLTSRSVWSVIEPGLLMRRSVFDRLGGFESSIGTGASTPWQAGEGTDLLLRYLEAGESSFTWIPASVAEVRGLSEPAGLSGAERRRKLRAYGRGIGHIYRVHGYSLSEKARILVGGLLIGVRRRNEYGLLDGATGFIGRLEGVLGRVAPSGDERAVTR